MCPLREKVVPITEISKGPSKNYQDLKVEDLTAETKSLLVGYPCSCSLVKRKRSRAMIPLEQISTPKSQQVCMRKCKTGESFELIVLSCPHPCSKNTTTPSCVALKWKGIHARLNSWHCGTNSTCPLSFEFTRDELSQNTYMILFLLQ